MQKRIIGVLTCLLVLALGGAARANQNYIVAQSHLTADGKRLLVRLQHAPGTPEKPGGIIGWDVESGRQLFRHQLIEQSYDPYVPELLFSPDGTLYCRTRLKAATPDNFGLHGVFNPQGFLFRAATGEVVSSPEKPSTETLYPQAFSADGKLLAGITSPAVRHRFSSNDEVKFWDTRTGKRVHLFEDGRKQERVASVLFSDDNRLVLTSVLRLNSPEKTDWWVVVRDRATGEERYRFPFSRPLSGLPRPSPLAPYRLSPDGRYLAWLPWQNWVSNKSRMLEMWDMQTGMQLYSVPLAPQSADYRDLNFSADSSRLLAFGAISSFRTSYWQQTWDVATGKELGNSNLPINTRRDYLVPHPFFKVISPDGRLLARHRIEEDAIILQVIETGKVLQNFKVELRF